MTDDASRFSQTARLILRKLRLDDAPLIFRTHGQDEEVTWYLMWRPRSDVQDAQAAVERFLSGWMSGTRFSWLIFTRDTEELAGSIAARDENGVNLWYLLARSFWGRGLMAEAISAAVVQWAFGDRSVLRIWAVCDVENRSSARMLEKPGFVYEGILKQCSVHPNISAVPRDCYSYAQTRRN